MKNDKTAQPHSLELSEAALERLRILEDAQKQARKLQAQQTRALRRKQVMRGIQTVGKAIQKVNIGKWIDDLEKEQELADELERINAERQQEEELKAICRQAEAACLKAIQDHLDSFLEENPNATFEDWIRELHPDNIQEKDDSIDERFYTEAGDHRMLWNKLLTTKLDDGSEITRKYVEAQSPKGFN